jgi:predicted ATPase
MLLSNLEIQRFRTFDYLHIEKLGKVNLIVGRNNVGKSTVLEAIRLYANLGAPHVLMDILKSRDDSLDRNADIRFPEVQDVPAIQNLFHGYPSLPKISEPVLIGPFKSPDSTLNIGLSWYQSDVSENGKATLKQVERHDQLTSSQLIPALTLKIGEWTRTFRLDRDFKSYVRKWQYQPKSFLDLATPCISVGPNGIATDQLARLWQSVALSDLEKDVVDCLNIVYPGIEAIAVLTDPTTNALSVRVKHPKYARPHPLKSLGDGTGRLFGLTLALVAAKDGILLVDEIENGVHYSVLVSLWKFIAKVSKRLNVQVFATSHSLDCIKAFHEVTAADATIEGVLNRVETRKGEIRSVLFDESKLDRFLEEGIELR